MSKELEALNEIHDCLSYYDSPNLLLGCFEIIEAVLKEKEKQDYAIRDLMANHIELVVEKDKAYFKIKNSKGKEKSFTSYAFIDFWKEVLS